VIVAWGDADPGPKPRQTTEASLAGMPPTSESSQLHVLSYGKRALQISLDAFGKANCKMRHCGRTFVAV
jgi:hypothetical protein